ncbi:hypothetical protein ACFVFQ_12050 [Streptomyces sp. NPDC057743]|uniref:hypothetical protein n=1 Tax=Streptomyces sp. NPDC057743 TaxID=3346236 RepID=UPI0036A89F44
MGDYASNDAAAALARAAQLGSTVRKGTRWYVRYQFVFGGVTGLAVFAIGVLKAPYGVAVGTGLLVAVVSWLSVYAARQPVSRRGFGIRHGIMIGTWGLLYAAVLALGIIFFPGVAAWWVPGAVVVALPGLIGGYLEARR